MDTERAPNILLLVSDAELARRCVAILRDEACDCVTRDDLFDFVCLDLIVADRPVVKADWVVRTPFAQDQSFSQQDSEIGVIALGAFPNADVQLAIDASDREIALACRLLLQVVQLRRKQAAAVRTTQMLAELVGTDPLTGLLNRRAWDVALATNFREAQERSANLCLALVDLDHFKQINSQFGLPSGDAVLQAAAGALQSAVRKGDIVARLGGDEFALLLDSIDPHAAASVVERIRESLTPALSKVVPVPVTTSAGLAVSGGSEPFATAGELFAAADRALRAAKTSGRNRTEHC